MSKDRSRKKASNRKENIREERKSLATKELLNFSFKYLDQTQPNHSPETISMWQQEGLLEPFVGRLRDLSMLSRDEAEKQKQIKIYGGFPPPDKTDFYHPKHVDENVPWSVIKCVGGQLGVVAGFIVESTFYVVFFDKNHRFWISEKKHT